MANLLNHYFVTVSSKVLGENHIRDHLYTVPPELIDFVSSKTVSNETFNIPLVTENFVRKELLNLNIKKSMGDDGIKGSFLRLCTSSILSSVTMLINESILTSEYPTAWKVAKVIALPKVGDNKGN